MPLASRRLRRFPSTWRETLAEMRQHPSDLAGVSDFGLLIIEPQLCKIVLRFKERVNLGEMLQDEVQEPRPSGKAANWLKKYPCCFEVYRENYEYFCRLTKRMMFLVEEEESIKDSQELVFVERLAKLLMMSRNQRLNVSKVNELKRNFGFPDDYLLRIVPKHTDMFRVVNYTGKRSSMDIELISWNPDCAVSAVEKLAKKKGSEPSFSCLLPATWVKSWERFLEFNSTPYISPYADSSVLSEGSVEMDKRNVALVHELLSMTLWKKLSISKLGHFKREFGFPEKLNVLLLKHPGIFYVSNKYKIYTVLLREAYNGSELIEKDPLVVVKNKFGELMQEGLHEYNRRHYLMNLEKKKKKGVAKVRPIGRSRDDDEKISQLNNQEGNFGGILDAEERKRFYKVLFGDDAK
ncbi:hypothetical protein SASPL_150572 [Salvia splendens]|uniref:PORR domain-containing protein n=1 Tax=Salvia splendens TaxID=180675 RepID=A0A8X8Z2K5_SALSN|nr:hypothetical protein SASPL_150572 [Salvia splendens]